VRWTQWIFLKLYERGLAYEGVVPINWCPVDKTGLANEEVSQGRCERCGALVVRKDLRQWSGFSWQNWQQAAAFCAQNKINLPEALRWSERSVSDPYVGGDENFTTLMTLSQLQALNGRDADAAKSFDKAINHPTANPLAMHGVARQLMASGKKDQAIRVFQLNAKRFPNQWPVHVGLMRAYAAMGDRKKALDEAKLALASAPDTPNRQNLQGLIQQLEAGKDIN